MGAGPHLRSRSHVLFVFSVVTEQKVEQDTHTEHGANPARTGDDWRNRAVCGEQNCPAHEQEAACEKVFHYRYPHYATQLNL